MNHMTRKMLVLSVAIAAAVGGGFSATAFAQATPNPATPTTQAADDAIPVDDATDDAVPADTSAAPMPADAQAAPMPAAATPLPLRDPTAANPAPPHPELLGVYKQFGEEAGLVALMDDFMVVLLADKRTKPFFENADQAMIKKHLVEQFCVILGGPCNYTGRDMKSSHANLGVDRGAFNALVEDLQVAMNKRKIPFRAQNKLLATLAPMHREIETL
jgi:hemoglobin